MESKQPDKKKVTVTKERDVRIQADLWHTSQCLLLRGIEQEKASMHQFRGSLVFTTFALEAYLNWLGSKLFPHWLYLERLRTLEKIALIADQTKVKPDYSKPPWQTIKPLFNF